jgi:acetylornithine aminotransferase
VTAERGALLILDEVQTGIGRTGAWFAFQRPEFSLGSAGGKPAQPDVVTLAKGLGGGIPIGAAVAFGSQAAHLLSAGQHGTTFGGNPVAAAAGLATLHVIERDGLVQRAEEIGARLKTGIEQLAHPLVQEVRGHGLLLAIGLAQPVAPVVAVALLEAGFIVNPVEPSAIRLAPPLIITAEQVDTLIAALRPALDSAQRSVA